MPGPIPGFTNYHHKNQMITHEAQANKKTVASLCQTSPLDGGSKERNAEEFQKWKAATEEKHGEVEFLVFFD